MRRTCEHCSRPVHGSGLCSGHYQQRRRGVPIGPLGGRSLSWEERFWGKLRQVGDCWEWVGARSTAGYGVTSRARRLLLAHRVAWTELRGEVPAGLQLDHLCRNRACANPWHLEPVTNAVNTRRGFAARREGVALWAHLQKVPS